MASKFTHETPSKSAAIGGAGPGASAGVGSPVVPATFADLLRQFGARRGNPIEAIRNGFPAILLKDAGEYFAVPTQRIRNIIRLPETTALALVKRGALMDAAASERLWRLADVMSMASEIFDDEESAKTWLRTPNLTFHDVAPMDYLDTEPGAAAVRQVLMAMATGGAL